MNSVSLLKSPNIKIIHFIGIGGISMSGLAEILASQGFKIKGSDMSASAITQKLQNFGMHVSIGHHAENVEGADLVVYTAAIKDTNPELIRARELNIQTIDRAELLGEIMKNYPHCVAVSGTHGKTTTTSMISMIMMEANLDPTIHIGGELDVIGGTTKIGGSKYFVAEACEYYESFLKFYPYLAVILNVEYDHADFFKDIEHVIKTFSKFAALVPNEGYVVACADDENVKRVLNTVNCNKITYGLNSDDVTWSAKDIVFDDLGCASFSLIYNGKAISDITLGITGIHNVSNALAAIASCSIMGCDLPSIKSALKKFKGTHRRFEFKGIINNIKVIDDYAHHPSEVTATLKAAKNCSQSRIWCVFQPHTYTRTKFLMDDFAVSFKDADFVILADIYAAREPDTGEVNSDMLRVKINQHEKKAIYMKSFEDIVDYLKINAKSGDLIITMGAGDIHKVGEMFLTLS